MFGKFWKLRDSSAGKSSRRQHASYGLDAAVTSGAGLRPQAPALITACPDGPLFRAHRPNAPPPLWPSLTSARLINYAIGSTAAPESGRPAPAAATGNSPKKRATVIPEGGSELIHLETDLDSRLESADTAEELAIAAARQLGLGEEEQQRFGMAVRESVINAIVHGNRYNARKKVHLRISGGEQRLTVSVTDEGEGFDLESLPNPTTQENILQQSGRGIFLIRAFVDEFSVRRLTPKGTEVKMIKYLRRH